jgi:serine/threonine-protein kinase
MSPEQASGQPTDHRSDLFSLGAVLYFMATGHPPFRAEQPMAVLHRICNDRHRPAWEANAEIPDQLSEAIDRLLEKKPQRRFASAEQVAAALAETLATLQLPRPPRRRSVYRRLWHNNRRWAIGSLAAAAIVAVLGLAGFYRSVRPAPAGSAAGGAALPPALAEVLSSSASPAANYASELTRLESELSQLETVHRPERNRFLQHADPAWHTSLSELERDLSRVENFALLDLMDPKQKGGKQ